MASIDAIVIYLLEMFSGDVLNALPNEIKGGYSLEHQFVILMDGGYRGR